MKYAQYTTYVLIDTLLSRDYRVIKLHLSYILNVRFFIYTSTDMKLLQLNEDL